MTKQTTSGSDAVGRPKRDEEAAPEIPGFRLVRRINQGSMGVIWEAIQESLDRKVALKLMHVDLAVLEDFEKRFERESLVLAKLSHPNIVQIIDRGKADGACYFAMEYVESGRDGKATDLKQLMQAGELNSAKTLHLVTQVARALAFAHNQGVIHRDVKPSNVLIDANGDARVVDFGIANISRMSDEAPDERLTSTGMAVGTPAYMAPEQFQEAAHVDARCDVYALGVMTYEMLTGQLPRGSFEPPSELIPGLDPTWDTLVNKSIHPTPKKRLAGMEEVLNLLGQIASSQSVAASLSTTVEAGSSSAPVEAAAGHCPKCGKETDPDKKFCAICGAELRQLCPRCGKDQDAWQRYCGECGADLLQLRQCSHHLETGLKSISLLKNGTLTPLEKFEHCQRACREFIRAVKADPENEKVRQLLKQTNKKRLALALEAADYALQHRQYGSVLQLCRPVVEADAQNQTARALLRKVAVKRQEMLNKASVLQRKRALKQAVQVYAEARRLFPGDAEVAAAYEAARAEYERVYAALTETIPGLDQSGQYVKLSGILEEMAPERGVFSSLEETFVKVRQRVRVAERYTSRSQKAYDRGDYSLARKLSAHALELAADLETARALLERAENKLSRHETAAREIAEAREAQEWLRARKLLRGLAASQPLDRQLASALSEAERQAKRQLNGAALLVWTVAGGLVWFYARLLTWPAGAALAAKLPLEPLARFGFDRADVALALDLSLHGALTFLALAAVACWLRRKARWSLLSWLPLFPIIGAAAVAWPRFVELGGLAPVFGAGADLRIWAATATAAALCGALFAQAALTLFVHVPGQARLSGEAAFAWLFLGALGATAGALCQSWSAAVLGPYFAAGALGLAAALATNGFLLTAGAWRYALLPAASALGVGLTQLPFLAPAAPAGALVGGVLFGLAAQAGSGPEAGGFRRLAVGGVATGAWFAWELFFPARACGAILSLALVWFLWSDVLRVLLNRSILSTVRINDCLQNWRGS